MKDYFATVTLEGRQASLIVPAEDRDHASRKMADIFHVVTDHAYLIGPMEQDDPQDPDEYGLRYITGADGQKCGSISICRRA